MFVEIQVLMRRVKLEAGRGCVGRHLGRGGDGLLYNLLVHLILFDLLRALVLQLLHVLGGDVALLGGRWGGIAVSVAGRSRLTGTDCGRGGGLLDDGGGRSRRRSGAGRLDHLLAGLALRRLDGGG